MDLEELYLEDLTIKSLRDALRSFGLKTSGRKQELIERIEDNDLDIEIEEVNPLEEFRRSTPKKSNEDLTVKKLRNVLRSAGLKTSGRKQELIERIEDNDLDIEEVNEKQKLEKEVDELFEGDDDEKTKIPAKGKGIFGKEVKKLGAGTYGQVYLYEKNDGTEIAVKKVVLIDYNFSTEGDILFSNVIELAILKRINHPNVLKLIDYTFDIDNKSMYIGTEFMKLGELFKILPINSEFYMLNAGYQILSGLAYLHSLDILHLDLKPQNIFVSEDGDMRIGDFGLSRPLSCVDPADKSTNVVTLWYRAPELFLGASARQYGAPVDIWSIGCIFYKMLTGRPLFAERSNIDMLLLMVQKLGIPTEENWPGVSQMPRYTQFLKYAKMKIVNKSLIPDQIKREFRHKSADQWIKIIMAMLQWDPSKRVTAFQALKPSFFNSVRDKKTQWPPQTCLENLYLIEKPIDFSIDLKPSANVQKRHSFWDYAIYLAKMFKISKREYYTALYIHDNIDKRNAFKNEKDYTKLVTACLYIASGYYNYDGILKTSDFAKPLQLDVEDLLQTVIQILKEIDFKLIFTTCYDFFLVFSKFYSRKIIKLAEGLLYFTILLPENLYQTKPEQVALMALFMACKYYEVEFKHMWKITNKLIEQMKFCVDLVVGDELIQMKTVFSQEYAPVNGDGIKEVLIKVCK